MCTAVAWKNRDFYFGRNLDYEHTFGEEVVVLPRRFPLEFRHEGRTGDHYALMGIARVEKGYPLFFDGVNEKGLAMAGLNFTQSAVYRGFSPGKRNIAAFELISWVLSQCETVRQGIKLLENAVITDDAFSRELPPAKLHWLLADEKQTVAVEQTAGGLVLYDDPFGVLTNEPPFPMQLQNLGNFRGLSARDPEWNFAPGAQLPPCSRGMGALGLPGDLSSMSRFVRAAFVKGNSLAREEESLAQAFHILSSVSQQRGCCRVENGYEITQYTACCNASKGIYYYTTYANSQITAVDMHRENLDGQTLVRYPLFHRQQIRFEN